MQGVEHSCNKCVSFSAVVSKQTGKIGAAGKCCVLVCVTMLFVVTCGRSGLISLILMCKAVTSPEL